VNAKKVAWGLAGAKLGVHLLTLRPYGFFRDELYYIACSEHLAAGYVDQPPLCVVLLKAWRLAFGDSLAAVRLLPALVGAGVVLLTALLAIRLGGGALAALLAGLAVLAAPQFLGTAHYYSMNVLDELFWVAAAYVTVRALGDPRAPRPWVALGVVLGLGLMNKMSVLWLCAGLVAGLLATPARASLRTRWPYVAAALAAILFAPYVAWEIAHGWPTLEFMRNASGDKYVAKPLGARIHEQVDHNGLFAVPMILAGLWALLARRLGPRAAVLGWAFVVTAAIVASQRTAKGEYLNPSYPMVLAAGGIWWERLLARARWKWVRPAVASVLGAGMITVGAVSSPFALAWLSEDDFVAYAHALGVKQSSSERREVNELGQFFADMHGWSELAAAVADVYDALPPDEKPRATIWTRTGGYGPAAAIDFFGRARGLPPAVCAHNAYWFWGPGAGDGRAVIVVGGQRERFERYFESVEQVTTFECRWCRPDENHKSIYVGRRMKTPLAELWSELRYFD
jgi:hypothetical protein